MHWWHGLCARKDFKAFLVFFTSTMLNATPNLFAHIHLEKHWGNFSAFIFWKTYAWMWTFVREFEFHVVIITSDAIAAWLQHSFFEKKIFLRRRKHSKYATPRYSVSNFNKTYAAYSIIDCLLLFSSIRTVPSIHPLQFIAAIFHIFDPDLEILPTAFEMKKFQTAWILPSLVLSTSFRTHISHWICFLLIEWWQKSFLLNMNLNRLSLFKASSSRMFS